MGSFLKRTVRETRDQSYSSIQIQILRWSCCCCGSWLGRNSGFLWMTYSQVISSRNTDQPIVPSTSTTHYTFFVTKTHQQQVHSHSDTPPLRAASLTLRASVPFIAYIAVHHLTFRSIFDHSRNYFSSLVQSITLRYHPSIRCFSTTQSMPW